MLICKKPDSWILIWTAICGAEFRWTKFRKQFSSRSGSSSSFRTHFFFRARLRWSQGRKTLVDGSMLTSRVAWFQQRGKSDARHILLPWFLIQNYCLVVFVVITLYWYAFFLSTIKHITFLKPLSSTCDFLATLFRVRRNLRTDEVGELLGTSALGIRGPARRPRSAWAALRATAPALVVVVRLPGLPHIHVESVSVGQVRE